MAPHPFPQADPVLRVSGTDCTRIPNAKNSECSGQHCVVNKCNLGWHPNRARDACILNTDGPSNLKFREVVKREDSLTTNVVANAHVSSDLVAKVGAIVSLVSGLECTPSQIPASSSSSAAVISDLLGGIADATSTLIASTNVPSLLDNLDALLNVSSVLSSTISSCGCRTDLGLADLDDALGNIVAALLNLKSWSAHNVPLDLDLSGLLSGLGLNNTTVAAVVSSDLVEQIKSLVGRVVSLAGVSSSLPPPPTAPSNLSSINTNITNSIVNATVHIVNSTTVSSLVSSIGALVNVNDLASSLLDECRCVSDLDLGTFVANLAQVANTALKMQDWCDTHPVVNIPAAGNSSTGTTTSISNTNELPIDLGLSNLLGLLGPIESGVAVSGTTTNTLANDLLGGLAGGLLIGTDDVPPVPAVTSVGLSPELVTQLEGLVNLVTELQSSYTPFGPAALDPSTMLNPSLVTDVVQKTADLFNSPTAISLVTNIDALIAANSALQTGLTNCECVDVLGLDGMLNHLVLVTNAALELKNWCSSNSVIIFRRAVPSSSPPPPSDTLLSVSAASATIGVPFPSTLPVAPSSQGTSDTPIVIGLDNLLSELGLKGLKAKIEVDGLGNGLSSPVNQVLNGLGIGPANVRSRMVGRQTLEVKDRRRITAGSDASMMSELLTRIRSLVTQVLSMRFTLPARSVPQTPAIDNVIRATKALLSVSSVGAIEPQVNALVAASLASVKTLDNCGCVGNMGLTSTYESLVQIAEASLNLQNWCHGHSMLIPPSPSSSPVNSYGQPSTTTTNTVKEPIIIGLTKLLNEFGLPVGLNDETPLTNPYLKASVSVQMS